VLYIHTLEPLAPVAVAPRLPLREIGRCCDHPHLVALRRQPLN
jgi:hypothetical protein